MLPLLATARAGAPFDVDEAVATAQQGAPFQLDPGARPDTFRFRYRGRVRWAAEPELPFVVTLGQSSGESAARVVSQADDWFVVEADVAPGTWSLRSSGTAPWSADDRYWEAIGPTVHVDPRGLATCVSGCPGLWRALVLHPVAPGPMERVGEPRPVLRWESVPGADHYLLRWFEKDGVSRDVLATEQNIRVEGTSWTFPRDLPTGREVEWSVSAVRAADGSPWFALAHGNSHFLTPGVPATRPPDPAPPPAGTGFLGVVLVDVGLPFRPLGAEQVEVGEVLAGHPGAVAGLRPQDVVEAVDGRSVEDAAALIRYVSGLTPGSTTTLRVRRGGEILTVTVVVGARHADRR